MTDKKIYRLYNKETGKTIDLFSDFDVMSLLFDLDDDEIDYDEYRLVEK